MEIVSGYRPGCIGRVTEMHALYYHRHWNFGSFFEAKVATDLSNFFARFDDRRDGFWTVGQEHIEGSVAIDGHGACIEGAHLRWFIVAEERHGLGLGARLLESALNFCREQGYRRVFLWTFAGLDTARHLYERQGFRLVDTRRGATWGVEVEEQRFEIDL